MILIVVGFVALVIAFECFVSIGKAIEKIERLDENEDYKKRSR